MLPQLQKILEADDAGLEELIKVASQKAGPPDMQQFMALFQQGQGQPQPGAQQGLAPMLQQPASPAPVSQGMLQTPQLAPQLAPQVPPQGLAQLLQGGR